jgi:hypothetical protein
MIANDGVGVWRGVLDAHELQQNAPSHDHPHFVADGLGDVAPAKLHLAVQHVQGEAVDRDVHRRRAGVHPQHQRHQQLQLPLRNDEPPPLSIPLPPPRDPTPPFPIVQYPTPRRQAAVTVAGGALYCVVQGGRS